MATDNPFEAPKAGLGAEPAPRDLHTSKVYGGIGRLTYFGLSILSFIVAVFIVVIVMIVVGPERYEASLGMQLGLQLAFLVVGLVLISLRVKNMGFNPWWGLTVMIPIYGILVAVRCLAYPEGWADHRTLDTAGKVIGGLIVGWVLLCVGVVVAVMVFAPS